MINKSPPNQQYKQPSINTNTPTHQHQCHIDRPQPNLSSVFIQLSVYWNYLLKNNINKSNSRRHQICKAVYITEYIDCILFHHPKTRTVFVSITRRCLSRFFCGQYLYIDIDY